MGGDSGNSSIVSKKRAREGDISQDTSGLDNKEHSRVSYEVLQNIRLPSSDQSTSESYERFSGIQPEAAAGANSLRTQSTQNWEVYIFRTNHREEVEGVRTRETIPEKLSFAKEATDDADSVSTCSSNNIQRPESEPLWISFCESRLYFSKGGSLDHESSSHTCFLGPLGPIRDFTSFKDQLLRDRTPGVPFSETKRSTVGRLQFGGLRFFRTGRHEGNFEGIRRPWICCRFHDQVHRPATELQGRAYVVGGESERRYCVLQEILLSGAE